MGSLTSQSRTQKEKIGRCFLSLYNEESDDFLSLIMRRDMVNTSPAISRPSCSAGRYLPVQQAVTFLSSKKSRYCYFHSLKISITVPWFDKVLTASN
ncbi:hypothetical protein AVEN_49776-1 [Araneus ventricosus]|uniref:Uncharacterized protein n=1 Tax=Araneus ventricosus TaxID=182803 RepID=A0A4Y2SMY8_ARAVE|nr:hypothetical protein AVEN_49776-1 [Araneus ventricosus]